MNASPLSQAGRPLGISTPLGADVLGLRAIRVREQLSAGFTIEAELSSLDPDIKFDDIVGHPVTVRLDLPGKDPRFWHGYVARFFMVGGSGQYFHYRAVIVHWLWALSRSADCRIFQHQTVPDIVQQVFRDCGEKDFELRLSGTYPQVEYCVQYRETHFNFVSRLLEQEGIAYYYSHDEAAGTLVLADEKAAYDPVPGYETIRYLPVGGDERQQEAVKGWSAENEVQPTQYGLTDYNPLKPKESMLRVERTGRDHGINDRQVFDFPAGVAASTDAERLSRIRLDELQAASELARAQTTCLGLGVGRLFTLEDHPRAEQNREYLITALSLDFDAGDFSAKERTTPQFTCEFTAIPSSNTYRPPRSTPKPVVHGPQPAMVVGPAGEEIYTDKHGRVKVSFFWDREGRGDEKSSCWVRVSHGWAGKRMGVFFLPRIGHEVLIEFLEGDPDRPIVTGCVYNADNVPPYPLPEQKTKSTLKTLSSKGGDGYNELRFEDKKGSEQLFIHAEKNQDIEVENDETHWVGHDRTKTIDHDETTHVLNDRTETVDNNETITIHGHRTEIVDKNETVTVALMRTHTVGVNEAITVGAAQEVTVGGLQAVTVGLNRNSNIGKNDSLNVGKKLTIQAGDEILIKTGDASISMKKDGTIVIKGKDITVKGSGDIVIKGKKIAAN